jgi:hypothetical protein
MASEEDVHNAIAASIVDNKANGATFDPPVTLERRGQYITTIKGEDLIIPVRRVLRANIASPLFVANAASANLLDLISQKKRLLFGTSFEDVAAEAYVRLAEARISGNAESLLWDMVFSVFVTYTVSREWVATYSTLDANSIFKKFEIAGRVADVETPEGRRGNWVTGSNMNSHAVHLLGYLIVEGGSDGTSLGKLRRSKGTCFTPIANKTPQGTIMTAYAATVSGAEKNLAIEFAADFRVLIDAISLMMTINSTSVETMKNYCRTYTGMEF